MHHDVEARVAEVLAELVGHPIDAEVASLTVALLLPELLRRVFERVVLGVERVDLLELELAPVGHRERLIELPAPQERLENPKRRRPRAHTDRSPGHCERLGDRKPEPAIVRHACDECPLP